MGPMAVSWTSVAAISASALGIALLVIVGAHVIARLVLRRWSQGERFVRAATVPFRVLVLVVALFAVVQAVRGHDPDDWWWDAAVAACRVLAIGAGTWLVAAVVVFVEDITLGRTRTDVPDNRTARRVRTQVLIIRRLTIAGFAVVGLGAVLLTLPGARAVGASVLASAGLISVVGALAAQSTLANVFAGIQLAFSDAIRIDDVVVVEEEWGWIEEITLSYVVVRLWDDRRLLLPCTWFTSTPFQNWTRRNSELLGAVELDVDWRVDVAAVRGEVDRLVRTTELWDHRASVLQVTDAVGGVVRVRVLVTATDAGRLFDLRCFVREGLVTWLQSHHEAALPRQRVTLDERPPAAVPPPGQAG